MKLSGIASIEGIQDILERLMRSIALRNEERWDEALSCLDQAIALNPELPVCYAERARVLSGLHRFEEALDDFDFLSRSEFAASALTEWGALKKQMLEEAFVFLKNRLKACPNDPALLMRRGNLYRRTEQYSRALDDYDAILKHDPGHVEALNHQGNVFYALGRSDEAIASYVRAVEIDPSRAAIWFNLGNVYQALGHYGRARSAYLRALAVAPVFAEAQLEIGHCWLLEGNYPEGWPYYEWRWQTAQLKNCRLKTTQPLWLGGKKHPVHQAVWPVAEDDCLTGKNLLIWAEQGVGDSLQFVRFVPEVLAEGCQVILRVQSSIAHLIQGLDDRLRVIGDNEPVPFHDFHCPLMSLPFALGKGGLPRFQPYLHADKRMSEHWQALLGPKQRLRVGVVWAGRQYGLPNVSRDIPLSMLAPLADRDVELISLQKEFPQADVQGMDSLPELCRFEDLLSDFSQTAALMDNLGLVISVDTSVAHLAGALGKPCWLMLRHASEWRWQRDREDSPWYPSIKIFRQSKPEDWESVVSKIVASLPAKATA